MANNISQNFLKRLIKEDFDKKDQDLVGKLGFIINPAVQQIVNILNNGLNIEGLNVQQRNINLQVDKNGNPTTTASFTSSLNGSCTMIIVGRVQNLTSSTTYPTSAPFVSFSQNGTTITINNITGLIPNNNWQITLLACA